MLYKPQFKCLSISKLWYTLTYMLYEPQFKCLSLFSHFSNFVMFPIFEVTVDKIQLASPCFLCKTVIYKVNNTILRFNFSKQILLSMTKLPIPIWNPCIDPSKCQSVGAAVRQINQAMLPQWYAFCQTMYICVFCQQWPVYPKYILSFLSYFQNISNHKPCRYHMTKVVLKNDTHILLLESPCSSVRWSVRPTKFAAS